MSAEYAEHERNTHDDEDALEDVSKRNLKLREFSDIVVACEIEIHLSPECEVERGGEYADSCIKCSE